MLTQAAIAFWKYNLANPPPSNRRAVPLHALTLNETFTIPKFCNGLTLHDYQETGVRWMVGKFCNKTNCVLGDEVSNCLCAICPSCELTGLMNTGLEMIHAHVNLFHCKDAKQLWNVDKSRPAGIFSQHSFQTRERLGRV